MEVIRVGREDIGMFVVAVGNAFDGIKLYGPFAYVWEAEKWAENNATEWSIVEITTVGY